jgi:general secretion pathway protein C
MAARLITLAIWFAAVVGGMAWMLPLLGRPAPVPPRAVVAAAALPSGGAERLLGTPPPAAVKPPPAAESRFKLIGVIAPRRGNAPGLALISVDGKLARAVAVGQEVDAGTTVLAVGRRKVDLGPADGAPTLTLELPALPEPNRGRPAEVASAVPTPPNPGGFAPSAAPVRPGGVPMFGTAARGPTPPQPVQPLAPQPLPTAPAPQPLGEPAGGGDSRQ